MTTTILIVFLFFALYAPHNRPRAKPIGTYLPTPNRFLGKRATLWEEIWDNKTGYDVKTNKHDLGQRLYPIEEILNWAGPIAGRHLCGGITRYNHRERSKFMMQSGAHYDFELGLDWPSQSTGCFSKLQTYDIHFVCRSSRVR